MTLKTRQNLLLAILIIFYTVGIIGLHTNLRGTFLTLIPFNLLLSFGCLYLSFKNFSLKKHLDIFLIAGCGYLIEWIGIHTSWLFGNYVYGSVLGFKLDGVPLIIGLNWVLLTFGAAAIVHKWTIPLLLKALVSGVLMTALDWLMEPVAVRSGFWSWQNGPVPLYNYACWMIFSTLFSYWILERKTVETNKVSVGLFGIIVLFFAILNR
ncbi:carotenoid biosynthesis protein [Fluviicola sp.]|jgi:putative membrane protein|uniref:carotenoid biosynthesis protein n=1 Tax=Fluviicola sp. TaxID=1917219 RepID=UPI0028352D40|nr:carotenoid biosynthesis protein [Fluviicola sp.]MDR0803180.1 carotenoid biosynthesis protein [Fluviicola sp.]